MRRVDEYPIKASTALDDRTAAERLSRAPAHHLPGNEFRQPGKRRAQHRVVLAQRDVRHRTGVTLCARPPCTCGPASCADVSARRADGVPTKLTRHHRPGSPIERPLEIKLATHCRAHPQRTQIPVQRAQIEPVYRSTEVTELVYHSRNAWL